MFALLESERHHVVSFKKHKPCNMRTYTFVILVDYSNVVEIFSGVKGATHGKYRSLNRSRCL